MSESLHVQVRTARRERRMSQSELAAAVGCKQSAISMFETGRVGALSTDKIRAVCKQLAIEMPAEGAVARSVETSGFCPAFDCVSNIPYIVAGHVYLLPAFQALSSSSKHCRYCGERLEVRCPECGALASVGACCRTCGAAYIAAPEMGETSHLWVSERQRELHDVQLLKGQGGAEGIPYARRAPLI